ncbi:MAG: chromate transporter [Eubacterium sp.]|nr:chromate transporter [Eubacterium sp.]
MIYLQLFWEFFKTGLFAIGGGLATLPFLQDMAVRTGWFTTDQLTDMLAVSECTPGAIGINMATYAGFQTAGVPGAVCSTIGIITPSIIVVVIVAGILKKFQDNRYVQALFYGLRPASAGLIGAACIGVGAAVLFSFGGVSIADMLAGLIAGTGSKAAVTGGESILSIIKWKAVVLAAVLWPLMNLGNFDRYKENTLLKKLSKIHPIYYLAASAVIGIIFGFAD